MNETNQTTKSSVPENINEVTLKGVIIHKFVTPDVAILTINTGNSTPVVNFPKVVFFGDLRADVENNFKKGDHVTVTGNIQSSRKKENVKNQIMQSVFAESITKTVSVMEAAFGVSTSSSYKKFENTFKIAGEVMSLDCPADSMVRMTIRTYKNNRVSFSRYVFYTANPEEVLSNIHPRDFVYGLGCIQTSKKVKKNNETQYFQDYIITELAKA